MKIAIQGHPTRGKEVIQILENLGGINIRNLCGDGYLCYYLIDGNMITYSSKNILSNYKYYTLEEFEKEFPFKVGDRVVSLTTNFIGTVIKLEESGCYYVKYDNGNLACPFGKNLKLYKEMKEERNITLTLDKAKEWYNKGGELKEVALQAYSEEELNPLPKSWEEFCEKYPIKPSEAVICSESTIVTCDCSEIRDSDGDREICPSKKSAEAHLAIIQLEQLRDCWRQGWKPSKRNTGFSIKNAERGLSVYGYYSIEFLSFPTEKMAEEFLECFRDLIEKAGDLI